MDIHFTEQNENKHRNTDCIGLDCSYENVAFATLDYARIWVVGFFFLKKKSVSAKIKSFPDLQKNITVVTASSENHAAALSYLLVSLANAQVKVILYDLGLPAAFVNATKKKHSHFLEVRPFPFRDFPLHLTMSKAAGAYAWKPVILGMVTRELSQRYNNSILLAMHSLLWVDAGCYFEYIHAIQAKIMYSGVYVGPSSSLVGEKTHPAMYTYLNQNFSHWKTQRQVEASLVGFRLDPFICNKLIFPWEKCALQEACIAPAGSSRKNHRQDQSVLSYLIHSTWDLKTGFNIELQHPPPTSYFTTDFKHDGVQCKCDRNLYKLTGYIFAYSFYQWMCGTNVE